MLLINVTPINLIRKKTFSKWVNMKYASCRDFNRGKAAVEDGWGVIQ